MTNFRTLPFSGIKLPASDTHFSEPIFEIDHIASVLQLCPSRRTVIEGGGHVGGWTRILANHFKQVHVFEPNSDNFSCLVVNTEHFNNVKRYRKALGANAGFGNMHPPADPGNSGQGWVIEEIEKADFEIRTLDSYKFEDVDFIKLDVEGYEPFILEGARETVERWHPVILVEMTPLLSGRFGLDYMEPDRILKSWGYELMVKANKDYIYKHPLSFHEE